MPLSAIMISISSSFIPTMASPRFSDTTGSPPREGLVLGFGSLSLEDLEDGLTILLGMFNDRKLLEK